MPKSDDARLLALLWRRDDPPSPRSGLSVRRIVDAGVALADAAGLDALSMRALAKGVGAGAMSLYTYVPGKRELLALMVDHVVGALPSPVLDRGWRVGLESIAEADWQQYQRHAWLLDVPLTRPAIGPNVMQRYEEELAVVDGIGLDDLEMNAVIELVHDHVANAARRARDIQRDATASGLSDDEWWHGIVATLGRATEGREYPLSDRVGTAIGAPHLDTSYLLAFGLGRILDGVETLVGQRRRASEERSA